MGRVKGVAYVEPMTNVHLQTHNAPVKSPPCLSFEIEGSLPAGNQSEGENDHSLPPSAEAKNAKEVRPTAIPNSHNILEK